MSASFLDMFRSPGRKLSKAEMDEILGTEVSIFEQVQEIKDEKKQKILDDRPNVLENELRHIKKLLLDAAQRGAEEIKFAYHYDNANEYNQSICREVIKLLQEQGFIITTEVKSRWYKKEDLSDGWVIHL